MNIITLIFKGIILGVVLLIPGASASTVAILMGIYDGIIVSISDIFKNFKKSIQYLFPVGIGIFIGVIIASFIITRFILNYSYLIYSIFLGISLGCLPNIYQDRKLSIKDKKGIILMLISLLISILFSIIMIENNEVKEVSTMTYLFLFISGILGAIGCVIPGISGMIIVILLGYYPLLLKAITEILVLTNFFSNLFIIISFGIGLALGVLLTAKAIVKLIKKWPNEVNFSVFGFLLGSIFYIFMKIFEQNLDIRTMIISVISTLMSGIFTMFIDKMCKK